MTPNRRVLLQSAVFSLLTATAGVLHAADTAFTIDHTPSGGVEVKVGGKPFATYVVDQANKPYLWPVHGPTGKAMTRAYPMQKAEGEQNDHPHHRSITFGHEGAGGCDTWHERMTFEEFMQNPTTADTGRQRLAQLGSIKHREFTELKADAGQAVVAAVCEYFDSGGKRFLTEERRMTFRLLGDMRAIDFDQELIAGDGPVKFDDRKDAGLSIRVPTSVAVDSKKGGRIVNSDGLTDAAAWGKPATWCDYHGPVDGETLGIALLNHPSSFRHPTRWHVRTYGLFTANPFALQQYDKTQPSGAYELAAGQRLKFRHRFLFHRGDEKTAGIAGAFAAYAKEAK
jgi:hypothetical protein